MNQVDWDLGQGETESCTDRRRRQSRKIFKSSASESPPPPLPSSAKPMFSSKASASPPPHHRWPSSTLSSSCEHSHSHSLPSFSSSATGTVSSLWRSRCCLTSTGKHRPTFSRCRLLPLPPHLILVILVLFLSTFGMCLTFVLCFAIIYPLFVSCGISNGLVFILMHRYTRTTLFT